MAASDRVKAELHAERTGNDFVGLYEHSTRFAAYMVADAVTHPDMPRISAKYLDYAGFAIMAQDISSVFGVVAFYWFGYLIHTVERILREMLPHIPWVGGKMRDFLSLAFEPMRLYDAALDKSADIVADTSAFVIGAILDLLISKTGSLSNAQWFRFYHFEFLRLRHDFDNLWQWVYRINQEVFGVLAIEHVPGVRGPSPTASLSDRVGRLERRVHNDEGWDATTRRRADEALADAKRALDEIAKIHGGGGGGGGGHVSWASIVLYILRVIRPLLVDIGRLEALTSSFREFMRLFEALRPLTSLTRAEIDWLKWLARHPHFRLAFGGAGLLGDVPGDAAAILSAEQIIEHGL